MKVKICLEKDEDGVFVATCPSLPGCISQGKTQQEAIKNIKAAIKLHVNSLMEDGLPLKESRPKGEYVLQVNV